MRRAAQALLLPSAVACLILAGRSAPAAEAVFHCAGAQQPKQVAELLFGRDIGGRVGVGEAAWVRFVAHELTPRFPDGLTVSDAVGQWRDPKRGRIVREPAKRVEIVLPGRSDDEARLDAAAQAYKREFHQQSVGIIVRNACVSF